MKSGFRNMICQKYERKGGAAREILYQKSVMKLHHGTKEKQFSDRKNHAAAALTEKVMVSVGRRNRKRCAGISIDK